MEFVCQYGFQVIASPGGELELFIPELKSGSGVKLAQEMELSNYQCLRVMVEDTVVVPANSKKIMVTKVPGKCDGGLAIHFVQHQNFGRRIACQNGYVICKAGLQSGSAL